MNKSPGHYKDEKGYEYYWDGQKRSYIPDNTSRRVWDDANRATNVFVWIYVGILVLPFAIFVLVFIVAGILDDPTALPLLALLAVLIWVYKKWIQR